MVAPLRKVMCNYYGADRSIKPAFRLESAYIFELISLNLNVAEVGALIGDPARANILAALMDGRALVS